MVKLFFTIVASFIFSLASFIQLCLSETTVGLEAFRINPKSEIEITSQSMIFNSKTNVTEFFTDVVVKYGGLKLSAQNLTVSQSKTIDSDSNLTLFANGPVIVNNQKNLIRGDEATFIEENQEFIINGNVSLLLENNTIFGDQLVLNLKDGIAKISGSVRTTITPAGKSIK
jgi:lipopolysaccharide transport protein LptA